MSSRFRRLGRKLFIGITIITVLLYLLVCLVPFLQSGGFWFIAILGLGFPFLLLAVFVCLVIWLIMRSKWAILPAVALLLGWQQWSALTPFRVGTSTTKTMDLKKEGTVRVMTWNVSRWDEANRELRGGVSHRNRMMDLVKSQDADILCFQEFFESLDPSFSVSNIAEFTKMGYPYHYFFRSLKLYDRFEFGLCIFSRYPIKDSAQFVSSKRVYSEGFCYVDVQVGDKTMRVYNTHLESVGFVQRDYNEFGKLSGSKNILRKIKRSYSFRNEQAAELRNNINASPHHSIVCGDLNDVPNSYVYFTVKGNLNDAFLERGAGLGRTFRFIAPTLRIDYIFTSKQFDVKNFGKLEVPYSDHYPVIADVQLSAD